MVTVLVLGLEYQLDFLTIINTTRDQPITLSFLPIMLFVYNFV